MTRSASAALIALALSGGAAVASAPSSATPAITATSFFQFSQQSAPEWAVAAYRRRPALVIGLTGLLVVPPLALAGLLILRRRKDEMVLPDLAETSGVDHRIAAEGDAWLVLEGDGKGALELPSRTLIQIGREPDNDLCLGDTSVHRYHALIERSADAGFVILDVSGPNGNGVLVNGTRRMRTSLRDGDLIELGHAKLRFSIESRWAAAA